MQNTKPRNINEWISSSTKASPRALTKLDIITYLFFGITGPIWTFPITYRFGKKVAGWLSSSDESGWGYSFVVISGLSSAALFARLGNLIVKNFIAYRKFNEENLVKNKKTNLVFLANLLLIFTAAITSIPSTYESYKDYKKIASIGVAGLITTLTLLNLTVKNVWSLNNLMQHLYRFVLMQKSDRNLTEHNRKVKAVLRVLVFYKSQLPMLNDSDLEKNNFKDRFSSVTPLLSNSNKSGNRYQIAFKLLGALVGAIGSYYSFPLARAGSADFFIKSLAANKATTTGFSYIFGSLAFLFNASLLTYTGYDCFGKFYDAVTCSNSLKPNQINYVASVVTFLVGIIALIGGAPVAEMTYENIDAKSFYGPIVISFALLAMASSKYWAMKGILNSHTKSPNRIATERTLNKLQRLTPNLNDEQLGILRNSLCLNSSSI